jgi:hypothetical protein
MGRTANLAIGAALLAAALSVPAASFARDHHRHHGGGHHHGGHHNHGGRHNHGNFNFSFGLAPSFGYYDDYYYYDEPQQVCGWIWRHHRKRWTCWWE